MSRGICSTKTLLKSITIFKDSPLTLPQSNKNTTQPPTDRYLSTPKSIKYNQIASKYPIVKFNLLKIQSLSGQDKIDLLRDFVKSKQTLDALAVYEKIIENGFSNRLKYHDHHTLFHLLLKDVNGNERAIKVIERQMKLNEYEVTDNFMNEIMICYCKWGDLSAATDTYATMVQKSLEIRTSSIDHLFNLYLNPSKIINNSKDSSVLLEDGLKLWNALRLKIPVFNPSRSSWQSIIKIHLNLNDHTSALEVYQSALQDISRLLQDQSTIDLVLDKVKFRSDTAISYLLLILPTILTGTGNGHEFFQSFYTLYLRDRIYNLNAGLKVYQVLLKYSTPEKSEYYYRQMGALGIKADYLVYCRLISNLTKFNPSMNEIVTRDKDECKDSANEIKNSDGMVSQDYSITKESIEELYRIASTTLGLRIGSKQMVSLDTTYIKALSALVVRHQLDIDGVVGVLGDMRSGGRRLMGFGYTELIEAVEGCGGVRAGEVKQWMDLDLSI